MLPDLIPLASGENLAAFDEIITGFFSSAIGIVLALLALFYLFVTTAVPFLILGIRNEIRQIAEIKDRLRLLLNEQGKFHEQQAATARDLRTMRRIMTGETTPEEEKKKAEERGSV